MLVHLGGVIKLNTGMQSSARMADDLLHKLVGQCETPRGVQNSYLFFLYEPHLIFTEKTERVLRSMQCAIDLGEGKNSCRWRTRNSALIPASPLYEEEKSELEEEKEANNAFLGHLKKFAAAGERNKLGKTLFWGEKQDHTLDSAIAKESMGELRGPFMSSQDTVLAKILSQSE